MILNFKTLLLLVFLINVNKAYSGSSTIDKIMFDTKRDSTLKSQSITIDGVKYKGAIIPMDNIKRNFVITDQKGYVVYKQNDQEQNGVLNFRFVDFNQDGYKDVILDMDVADSEE